MISISALPFELAAAGRPTWAMLLTPDTVARRSPSGDPARDKLTMKGAVIAPDSGFDHTDRYRLITATVAAARRDLSAWVHRPRGPSQRS